VIIDKRFPKSSIEPFHAGIYLLRWAISALIGTALVISGGITLHFGAVEVQARTGLSAVAPVRCRCSSCARNRPPSGDEGESAAL